MTTATARKVDLVLRELRARQERGEIKAGTGGIPLSTKTMARISREINQPLDEKTFRNIEADALAKLKNSERARLALDALLSLRSHQPHA